MTRGWALAVLAGLLATGCARRGRNAETPKPTEVGAVEAELLRNEAALREVGVHLPSPPPSPRSPAREQEPDLPVATPEEPAEAEPVQPLDYDDSPELSSARDQREDAFEAEMDAPAPRTERRRSRMSARERRKRQSNRCERICDLAVATCELYEHICQLAEAHPDEPRYEESCLRAELQCDTADRACRSCEDE